MEINFPSPTIGINFSRSIMNVLNIVSRLEIVILIRERERHTIIITTKGLGEVIRVVIGTAHAVEWSTDTKQVI